MEQYTENINIKYEVLKFYINAMIVSWDESEIEPNLFDVICQSCGWNPLEVKQKMTITYGVKEYKVYRVK
jgi:hypothetical protein